MQLCANVDLLGYIYKRTLSFIFNNRGFQKTMMNSRSTTKNVMLKVVILGDGGVGKSCLMNRFVSNHFDEHSFHTIGVEFLNKDIEIDGEIYTLQVRIRFDIVGVCFKTFRVKNPRHKSADFWVRFVGDIFVFVEKVVDNSTYSWV